ncbi:uncharacterized protein LOC114935137 [Nylanderia fulva]|uniref:uncharacterized protein LOC114935137 n=1 Tax=Nylanderia fulva TaxID=613905 RepID=UPI0010FB19EA|nr:uncharacterized protein LOC114935137 [Nylanderia fulva]
MLFLCFSGLKKKSGDGLIVLIIYHSVARRLGLRCNVIDNCPYYIFWKPKYTNDGLENVRYLLVERQDDLSWPTPLLSDFHEFYKMYVNKVWNYLKINFKEMLVWLMQYSSWSQMLMKFACLNCILLNQYAEIQD